MYILFIYADDCKDCSKMKKYLEKAKEVTDCPNEIKYVNSETDEAIDLAIEYGIEDIPGCVIGDFKFFGKKGFSYNQILKAFKNINRASHE